MAQDIPDATTRPPSPSAAPDTTHAPSHLTTPTLPAPVLPMPTLPAAVATAPPTVGPYAPPPGSQWPAEMHPDDVPPAMPMPSAVGQRNVVVQTRSRSHRRIRGRSDVATAGIVLSMATGAYTAFVVLQQRQELIRIRDGVSADRARIVQLDDRLELATYMAAGAFLIAGVSFLIWFHRAYKNIKTMGRNRFTPGWAIGAWAVPFLNLVRPYQMMKELTTESPRHRPLYPPNAVGLWWSTVLINIVLNGALERIQTDTVDELITWDTIRPFGGLLWLIAGGLLISLVRRVTRAQDAWFDEPVAARADVVASVPARHPAYPG